MVTSSIKRLYYSIGEVSKITDLEPHVLRYWESEFPQLKPSKNKAGNRTYRVKDIQLILLIKKLLHQDKFTIEGAKQRLQSGVEVDLNQMKFEFREESPQDLLLNIKHDLQGILTILND
jgi:DNA-binding transcriptional MerR regulator